MRWVEAARKESFMASGRVVVISGLLAVAFAYAGALRPAVIRSHHVADKRAPAEEDAGGGSVSHRASRVEPVPTTQAKVRPVERRATGETGETAEAAHPVEEPPAPAEVDMAEWMLHAIRSEEWDRQRTEQVEEELAVAMARTPRLALDDVECGRRFCSATVSAKAADAAALNTLWGLPPFDGEGFTRSAGAGKVAVFFARRGESLDQLKKEAAAARAP
jgi:hypothetical protein